MARGKSEHILVPSTTLYKKELDSGTLSFQEQGKLPVLKCSDHDHCWRLLDRASEQWVERPHLDKNFPHSLSCMASKDTRPFPSLYITWSWSWQHSGSHAESLPGKGMSSSMFCCLSIHISACSLDNTRSTISKQSPFPSKRLSAHSWSGSWNSRDFHSEYKE